MADFNPVVSPAAINPLISGEVKKRGGLDFRVYQELKSVCGDPGSGGES